MESYLIKVEVYPIKEIEENYLAWVEGEKYRGTVVSGNSLSDVLNNLSISIKVLNDYRDNERKKSINHV